MLFYGGAAEPVILKAIQSGHFAGSYSETPWKKFAFKNQNVAKDQMTAGFAAHISKSFSSASIDLCNSFV